MDAGEMAEAIGYALNGDGGWKAAGFDIGEILFENEDGEKFVLTVEKVDRFWFDDEEAAP